MSPHDASRDQAFKGFTEGARALGKQGALMPATPPEEKGPQPCLHADGCTAHTPFPSHTPTDAQAPRPHIHSSRQLPVVGVRVSLTPKSP